MNRNVIGQQAPGGSQERRRLTGAIMLAAFLLLSAILTFGQLPRGGPDLVGDVWKVDVDGHPCILFLTETEVVSLREFPGRYRPAGRVEDRVQNHLNVVRADEGGRLARTKIAEREHSRTVDLLGVAGGWIWLLSDGIEAREPRRLRRTLSKKDLRRANPDEAGGIDDEARFYALTPSLGGLAVRTTDGRLHLVQPPDPAFHPLDRLPEPSSIASEKTEHLTFAADAVVGDRRLLLASDYERQSMDDLGLRDRVGRSGSASDSEPRRLYVARPDGSGGIERLDDRVFLRGAILAAPNPMLSVEARAWILSDPPSALLWSEESLAPDEPWRLTRVDGQGAVLWSSDTGLRTADGVLDLGSHAVFVGGGKPRDGANRGRDLVVSIDLRSGRRTVLFGEEADE